MYVCLCVHSPKNRRKKHSKKKRKKKRKHKHKKVKKYSTDSSSIEILQRQPRILTVVKPTEKTLLQKIASKLPLQPMYVTLFTDISLFNAMFCDRYMWAVLCGICAISFALASFGPWMQSTASCIVSGKYICI